MRDREGNIFDVYVDVVGIPGDGERSRQSCDPFRDHISIMLSFAETEIVCCAFSGLDNGLTCDEIAHDLHEVAARWFLNVQILVSEEFRSFIVAGEFAWRALEDSDYDAYKARWRSLQAARPTTEPSW